MVESPSTQKVSLRRAARQSLAGLTPAQKESAGRAICSRLATLPAWKTAHSLLLYAPRPDEPDLRPLAKSALRDGKHIALPRFVADSGVYEAAFVEDLAQDLVAGRYGILEPGPLCKVAELNRLDLVLVPGLAFDWHGYRLGRGKGFYDRLLAAVSGTTCGVAFDSQLISAIPVEPHDVRLNCILTPTHCLEFPAVRGR